jgi:hypothetical protein
MVASAIAFSFNRRNRLQNYAPGVQRRPAAHGSEHVFSESRIGSFCMKIALQNSFPDIPNCAESNFIFEAISALRNLGHQALEVTSPEDITAFAPDVVLTTHEITPKLTEFPTVGLMWNPPDFIRFDRQKVSNLLTYDAYMSGSQCITDFLRDVLTSTGKKSPILEFVYCSCSGTSFVERKRTPLSVFYAATGWDRDRYKELLHILSQEIPLQVFGAQTLDYLGNSYKGPIFGARALLKQIRHCGIGLALHRHEHRVAGSPNRRLFEIAAAGAIIIGDDFYFSRAHFDGTIFFVDPSRSQREMANEIKDHYTWINDHYIEAMLLARNSHSVFLEHFCLEQVFSRLPTFLQSIVHGRLSDNRCFSVALPEMTTRLSPEEAKRCAAAAGYDYTKIPIFINNRNRLSTLRTLLNWLRSAGYTNVFVIDNDSSYPPLLDYYDQLASNSEATLIRLERNVGPYALWESGLLQDLRINTPFVYTDSDVVPTSECPSDILYHFQKLLALYPDYQKVGCGLKIDDLPDHYEYKLEVTLWESQFWESTIDDELYVASVDTTFALYRSPETPPRFVLGPALRTGQPYLARHLPWYADSEHPDEEDRYYVQHSIDGISHWSLGSLPSFYYKAILGRLVAQLAEKEAQLALASSATLSCTKPILNSIKRYAPILFGVLVTLQRHGLRAAVSKTWSLIRTQGLSITIRKVKSMIRPGH